MPIPCVDLLIENEKGKILLIKRSNEPAKGQWWFPGGRVHFKETRIAAAQRKLHEECGLQSLQINELGTADVVLDMPNEIHPRHCISTLFHVRVANRGAITLDSQSHDSDWRTHDEWLAESVHTLIKQVIASARFMLNAQQVKQGKKYCSELQKGNPYDKKSHSNRA